MRLCERGVKFQSIVVTLFGFVKLTGPAVADSKKVKQLRILKAAVSRLTQVRCGLGIVFLAKIQHSEIAVSHAKRRLDSKDFFVVSDRRALIGRVGFDVREFIPRTKVLWVLFNSPLQPNLGLR